MIHFSHIVINARSIPSLKLIYIFRSSKTKLRKQNNSVVYSVWLLRYTVGLRLPVCVCFYKIHKYVASSRQQLIRRPTILIASLQGADLVYYSFKNVSISSKKKERLVYRVISCDGLGGSIACAWNSPMVSSLSQIRVACSTMKMSSFPLEIVKNIHHEKL